MEVEVHRMKWGVWIPSPIQSLSYDSRSGRLAIGRQDASIEICCPGEKWYVQVRVPGKSEFQLQALGWAKAPNEQGRLFGISLRGFLFEIDLYKLNIIHIRDSYGGAAWCMSLHPREALLAVGCEDGAVRIFSYADGGLEYSKTFPTVGSRVLCVAYHPSQPKLFVGCADGHIRCFNEVLFITIMSISMYYYSC